MIGRRSTSLFSSCIFLLSVVSSVLSVRAGGQETQQQPPNTANSHCLLSVCCPLLAAARTAGNPRNRSQPQTTTTDSGSFLDQSDTFFQPVSLCLHLFCFFLPHHDPCDLCDSRATTSGRCGGPKTLSRPAATLWRVSRSALAWSASTPSSSASGAPSGSRWWMPVGSAHLCPDPAPHWILSPGGKRENHALISLQLI